MAYILFEDGVGDVEKRISKLNDLALIFSNGSAKEIIDEAIIALGSKPKIMKRNVWFVAQGDTFLPSQGRIFLWAPTKDKVGNSKFYWENLKKVKKGDIIFNYSEGIKGVSLAKSDGFDSINEEPNNQWNRDGFRVDIDLTDIAPFISGDMLKSKKNLIETYCTSLTKKPFDINGKVNQGYLYEFTKEAGRFIRDLYGKEFGNKEIDDFFDVVSLSSFSTNNNIYMESLSNYYTELLAIKTKPFILLAGLSGTGKSRLARTLAYKSCFKEELRINKNKPGNFELIPVRPNWHDSSELMGYVSRINDEKYITTPFLKFIAKAWKHLDIPFFLCLDEMNLAPVEQYFAEFLSIIETRQKQEDQINTDFLLSRSAFENEKIYTQILHDLDLENRIEFIDGLAIPPNLIVIGTVNMDETTHSFSRKVLDRAMTIEMNEVDLSKGLNINENDWSYPSEENEFIKLDKLVGHFTSGSEVVNLYPESNEVISFLQKINVELEGTPFKIAYRVRDEFLIYCFYSKNASTNKNWLQQALDDMVSMKILSRIEGDETKTGETLKKLKTILNENFKKSNKKLIEMETRLQKSGYTSYWS